MWIYWPWIGSLVLLPFSISGCSFPNPHFPGRKEETALLSLGEFPCFSSSCFPRFKKLYPNFLWGMVQKGQQRGDSSLFQSFPILLRIFYIPFALGISYFFYWILSFLGKYPLHKKILGRKSSLVGALGRKLGLTGAWEDQFRLSEVLENVKRKLSLWGKYSLVIYLFHRPFRDFVPKDGRLQLFPTS